MTFSRLFLITLVMSCATPTTQAQYAGAFSRLPLGARSATVGGLTADLTGAASPYHNPALAPYQSGQGIEISTGLLAFNREWQALQVGAPLRPQAGLAAGIVRGAVTNIDGRDASGYHTGTLSTNELAFFVAFGSRFTEHVSGGLGLRLYRSNLVDGVDPATGLGISLGTAVAVTDRLSLGLAVDDLFARYEWNATAAGGGSATDRFPVRIRTGASYASADGRGLFSADVEVQAQTDPFRSPAGIEIIETTPASTDSSGTLRFAVVQARVGGEIWLAEPFAVRLGADRATGDFAELRPSGGFGLVRQLGELNLRLDYAATLEPNASGITHLATLRLEL